MFFYQARIYHTTWYIIFGDNVNVTNCCGLRCHENNSKVLPKAPKKHCFRDFSVYRLPNLISARCVSAKTEHLHLGTLLAVLPFLLDNTVHGKSIYWIIRQYYIPAHGQAVVHGKPCWTFRFVSNIKIFRENMHDMQFTATCLVA